MNPPITVIQRSQRPIQIVYTRSDVAPVQILSSSRGLQGEQGEPGESVADPGDLTLYFDNGLI